MCISKEKAVLHYVDLIVTVFEENPKIAQGDRVLNANYRRTGVGRGSTKLNVYR